MNAHLPYLLYGMWIWWVEVQQPFWAIRWLKEGHLGLKMTKQKFRDLGSWWHCSSYTRPELLVRLILCEKKTSSLSTAIVLPFYIIYINKLYANFSIFKPFYVKYLFFWKSFLFMKYIPIILHVSLNHITDNLLLSFLFFQSCIYCTNFWVEGKQFHVPRS